MAPSFLTLAQSNALALMGAFVLVFIIRMAGATMEQKERAEASTRLSEDRFRSLIQHSSDATLVIDEDGDLHLRQPGHHLPARAGTSASWWGSDPPRWSTPTTRSG